MNDEQDLIRQAQGGDPGAFDKLVRPHLPRAFRTACGITHDRETASDALQEALLRAYRSLGNLRPERPFYPWFIRVLVNEAMKIAQRQARPVITHFEEPVNLNTPESSVLRREERHRLWQAIGSLSPAHRAVVVLRYYEDLSETAMAQLLGVSPGTVKSRLHYARQALEQRLSAAVPVAGDIAHGLPVIAGGGTHD